ncbi:MAG: DUF3592 domain-containing protein [Deltaproteobacteria bacterium]|nr:MAG: DUF3592 domain-containing protein [Deltaproteobacteria bacterium]
MSSSKTEESSDFGGLVLLSVILACVGLYFFIGGCGVGIYNIYMLKNGLEAQGTIVGMEEQCYDDGCIDLPVVMYKTCGGQTIRFTSEANNRGQYKIGDKVRVVYLSSNPEGAEIRSFMALGFGPLVSAIFGAGFLIVAIIFLRMIKKARADSSGR